LAVYQRRLAPHAAIVALHAYQHEDPLAIAAIDNQRFDFGFVDGPRDTSRRGAEIRYALDRCLWVACHDGMAAPIVAAMDQASAARRRVEVIRYDRNPGEPHAIGLIGPC